MKRRLLNIILCAVIIINFFAVAVPLNINASETIKQIGINNTNGIETGFILQSESSPDPSFTSLSPDNISYYESYASWNDNSNRNEIFVYIYSLEENTNITLYYTSSILTPIKIDTIAANWTNVASGTPLTYGPLINQHYFFKLTSNKPVTWELVTHSYEAYREASRFIMSSDLSYLGTTFYFHADQHTYEEIDVINPNTDGSGIVSLYNWTGGTWNFLTSTNNIDPESFWEYSVPSKAFYKIESENPVLVYEGKLYNQNMATGVTPRGDTVGNVIYAAVPYDIFAAPKGGATLHIMGVTGASYSVYHKSAGDTSWTFELNDAVSAGSSTTHENLTMDKVYKIVTDSEDHKIFVQYLTAWPAPEARGGAEMIPGIDNGKTTNPGTQFILYFDGGPPGTYSYQKYIDVLMPEAGTSVNINGAASTSFTSTVDDEAFRWEPGDGNGSVYIITSSKPVWVVVMSDRGSESGYFVFNSVAVPKDFEMNIDIDPDTLNLKSKGKWITCYIELTLGYDVKDIDAHTILLEDSLPPELNPKYGFVKSESSYIMDHDNDTVPERMVKFDRSDVEDMLSPGKYNLKVSGKLLDGKEFEGYSDEIRVIDPP
jgi:hypothetical protein